MLRTSLLLSVVALPTLGALLQNQSPSATTQTETSTPSKVVCSDSSTILPAKRSPDACAKSDFAKYGRPVMFPPRDGTAYGVSAAPEKPGSITIWMDNQTEKPQTMQICCNTTFVGYIDVYDESNRRVPSAIEISNSKEASGNSRSVSVCSCSGWVTVPAHSLKVIDHGDLSTNYAVSSGSYTIVEYVRSHPNVPSALEPSPILLVSGPRLIVSVP